MLENIVPRTRYHMFHQKKMFEEYKNIVAPYEMYIKVPSSCSSPDNGAFNLFVLQQSRVSFLSKVQSPTHITKMLL
jgi:hypothetical protein